MHLQLVPFTNTAVLQPPTRGRSGLLASLLVELSCRPSSFMLYGLIQSHFDIWWIWKHFFSPVSHSSLWITQSVMVCILDIANVHLKYTHVQTPSHTQVTLLWKYTVGACHLCRPLTQQQWWRRLTPLPMCLTHRPPEQRQRSVTEIEHCRTALAPPCSERLTSMCSCQIGKLSRELSEWAG